MLKKWFSKSVQKEKVPGRKLLFKFFEEKKKINKISQLETIKNPSISSDYEFLRRIRRKEQKVINWEH